jgi:MFS family permease
MESGHHRDSSNAITWRTGLAHSLCNLHCALAFMILFTAYNAVQNLSSSIIDGALGYWAIATTYITLCACCFFVSGALVARLGAKVSMLCGASCYCLFLLANRFPQYYTLIPTAALTGFGASLVWVGQGAYITACSRCYSIERRHDKPEGLFPLMSAFHFFVLLVFLFSYFLFFYIYILCRNFLFFVLFFPSLFFVL